MKYLVMTMRGPNFHPDAIPAHYEFLQDLRDSGVLEQAGPFTDSSGGAYVIGAATLEEALSVAHQDPLHVRNCSTVTVREWNAS